MRFYARKRSLSFGSRRRHFMSGGQIATKKTFVVRQPPWHGTGRHSDAVPGSEQRPLVAVLRLSFVDEKKLYCRFALLECFKTA
ncbi:hypothetical protein EVAR_17448_1 [Eumeta japonica]|uniref:Uncharacterized protein n=1 Tax=Eumeta variegata TaxID=151549 RepID=A0A4C1VA95_EUMVA|nr:hypothetical protein EVAR_17448_1 [Eumeta japonica]